MEDETLQYAVETGPSLLTDMAIPTTIANTRMPCQKTLEQWITSDVSETLFFEERHGDIYCDGSCFFPTHPKLAAAGWACVQVDCEGNLIKALYGCVPAHIEQSAVNAEHCALVCAASAIESTATIACDCAAVVDGWRCGYTGRKLAVGGKLTTMGTWRRSAGSSKSRRTSRLPS